MLIGALAFAQGDVKAKTAFIEISKGNNAKGVELINEAIELGLSEKLAPKAYYNLALAYNKMSDSAMLATNPEILFKLQTAIEKVKETDTRNKYKNKLIIFENPLGNNFNAVANNYYMNDEFAKAVPFLKASKANNPEQLGVNMLLGYAQIFSNDTTQGIAALERTLSLWDAMETKDSTMKGNIRSTYQMLSNMYSLKEKNPEKALDLLEKARKAYPTDPDLRNTELGIYQQNPQLFEKAKTKFEAALKEDNKNNLIKLAYAQLLTQNNDADRGLELYREVLESEPSNYSANVNLSAFYINKAVEVFKVYDETPASEEEKLDKLQNEYYTLLRGAYPYLEQAHQARPENRDWVVQLYKIATQVPELITDAKKWKTKLDAMN